MLVVLGVVVVLATPFYVVGWPPPGATPAPLVPGLTPVAPGTGAASAAYAIGTPLGALGLVGPPFARLGAWAGLYWVVALVVAGALVARHYRRDAARRGIAGPVRPLIAAGLVLLLVATPSVLSRLGPSAAALTTSMTLSMRGLTPLLVIALALAVLAWTERSVPLAVVTACFLALALVANLYDLVDLLYHAEKLLHRAGTPALGRADLLPNLLLPGLVLLVASLVASAVAARRRREGAR